MRKNAYRICYSCPHCKSPKCGSNPETVANDVCHAGSKAEARKVFNTYKACRHKKIIKIEKI